MDRTLIVARMAPSDAAAVAGIFAASDRTELPHRVGVRSRTLYRFHDLYFHLIEADQPVGPAVAAVREDPLFRKIDAELSQYVRAYDPATWRSPADAMATPFYSWEWDR
jgi:cyclase